MPQPSGNLFNNPLNQSMLFGQTKPFLNPPAPSNQNFNNMIPDQKNMFPNT